MTISEKLVLLQQDITNARTAVTAKGGSVTPSGGSSQLATDIATIPTGGGEAITVPISTNKDIDIDFSEHELYEGFTGDGALNTNRWIKTGITIPEGYHYNIEFKFRKTELISNRDENFISCFGNSYTKFRVGISRTGYIFCRGWNRTNLQSPNSVSLNEDHVVKLQYNNGTVSMYIDDVFQASNSVSETMEGGELLIGTFSSDGTSTSSTFLGTLYYIKMTDATHNNKVVLDWTKTIASDNNKPIIFINGGDNTNIQELQYHTLYGATGKHIDGANPLKVNASKWGGQISDFFNDSVPADVTLSDIVIPSGEFNRPLPYVFRYSNIKSFTAYGPASSLTGGYNYYYTLADCPNLEEINIYRGSSSVVQARTYALSYFAYNCPNLKYFYCGAFQTSASQCFYAALEECTSLEEAIFDNIVNANNTNAFSNTFKNCTNLTKVVIKNGNNFYGIGTSSSMSSIFNYAFRNCDSLYDENINRVQMPTLNQIGYNSSTTTYAGLKYAFASDTSSYYGKLHLILPELQYIYNRNSTTTNGHFAYCNALGKIYLPKFIVDGTTGKNIFNNCSYLTEIHFGIENQATVEALAGYSSKFGATNATLYFDLVNHITVNGTVYDRSGLEYDYDTSHYSWKNGTNVIYTTNALTPAVGDTVYTQSGTEGSYTYTASGTIGAIA